jgi:hypothetical protein
MSNDGHPKFNKDGTLHLSTGTGPVKTYQVRKYNPVDTADLIARGIVPAEGVSWDPDDPNSVVNMKYRKFGPKQRESFLTSLCQVGQIKAACIMAGVVPATVERHRREDPTLEEDTQLALEMFHAHTAAIITAQARAGMRATRKDKDGNVIYEDIRYETPIRKILLERADESYRLAAKSEVSVQSGVVAIPMPLDGTESWDEVVQRTLGSPGVGKIGPGVTGEPAIETDGEPAED